MSGWECTTYIAEPCTPHYDALRDVVLAHAVNDVGINRVRLELRSGVENTVDHYQHWLDNGCPQAPDPLYLLWRYNRYSTVNDNADPGVLNQDGFHFTELHRSIERVVLPMRALLQARGEDLFVNLCYVAFTSQIEGGVYQHNDPDEYAEFVLATKTLSASQLAIQGLPAGTYGVNYTTGGPDSQPIEYDVDLADITIADGEVLCTAIPALGLITVYGRPPCPADLDGSRTVGIVDFLAILSAWGNSGGPEDVDGSGMVGIVDLLLVLAAWGPCPS